MLLNISNWKPPNQVNQVGQLKLEEPDSQSPPPCVVDPLPLSNSENNQLRKLYNLDPELIFGATAAAGGRVKFLNNCVNLPENNANCFTISPSKR